MKAKSRFGCVVWNLVWEWIRPTPAATGHARSNKYN